MATVANSVSDAHVRERWFFFGLALLVAATTFAGFAMMLGAGRSSFGAPWWVHVHAVSFMGWLAIFLTQNWLVARGAIRAHRRLGAIAAAYALWMIVAGEGAMMLTTAHHRVPPFFAPSQFLAQGIVEMVTFGGLTIAAIVLRRRADWHRRLMLCAMMMLLIPGIERLMPVSIMGDWRMVADWGWIMVYGAIGMGHDVATRGCVHPAWLWGLGAITGAIALIRPLGAATPMVAFAQALGN